MGKRKRSGARARIEATEVASNTECTGLMPALPRDAGEDANSAALYDIHRAKSVRDE